jgi:flavin reductase (DIM6/NTAB) family NADH-FMN oxidoreductase RutF
VTEIYPRTLRSAFGCFPTGLTVITTREADGTPPGFTANSFTSASLDPPLLLVSIARPAASQSMPRRFAAEREAGRLGIYVGDIDAGVVRGMSE